MSLKSLFVRTRFRRIARLRAESMAGRITRYLLLAEDEDLDLHRRTDYREARIVVALAAANDPQPLVTASYRIFGVHPDKVWPHIVADRKAKLGREYSQWYDAAGNLRPDVPKKPAESVGTTRERETAMISSASGLG